MTQELSILGIESAKNVLHLVGMDEHGAGRHGRYDQPASRHVMELTKPWARWEGSTAISPH